MIEWHIPFLFRTANGGKEWREVKLTNRCGNKHQVAFDYMREHSDAIAVDYGQAWHRWI